jgi:nucleotide-binding universal stress UspA family protein
MDAARDAAHAYLSLIATPLKRTGIAVTTVAPDGDPASRLLSLVNDEKYDLVVMATHGRTGITRWMLGSVAERLVEASYIPVLLVRSAVRYRVETSHFEPVGAIRDAANAAR